MGKVRGRFILDIIFPLLSFLEEQFGAAGGFLGAWCVIVGLYYYFVRLPQRADLSSAHIKVEKSISDYAVFRGRVRAGGPFAERYPILLRSALARIDRFFHDDRAQDPTWTASSMDRALSLALAYPMLTMLVVYWITGASGPAERTLGLAEEAKAWNRVGPAISLIPFFAALFWFYRPLPLHRPFIYGTLRYGMLIVGVVFGNVVGRMTEFGFEPAFVGSVAVLYAVIAGVAGSFAVALAGALAFAAALGSAGAGAFAFGLAFACAFAVAFAVACEFVTGFLNDRKSSLGWWMFFPCQLSLPFILIPATPHLFAINVPPKWSLLLMVFVLPLINALFDWISLGLTRKLLRSGLQKGGFWPFIYAAVDVVAAIGLLFALLIVCLAYVHALNLAASSIGSPPLLDVDAILLLLKIDASDPSLWWIYIIVFTTFIPSLVNLCLGGLAIVRGVPGLGAWVVDQFLPQDPYTLTIHRRVMASLCLTLQLTVALLGAGFVGWLAFTLVFAGLGHVGLGLVSVATTINELLSALR